MVESNRLLIYRTFICTQGSNPCFSFIKKLKRLKSWHLKINRLNVYIYTIGIVVQLVRAPPCHGGSCEFESRQSRLLKKVNNYLIIIFIILLLNSYYSPWTFNKANPNERPNKVMKIHVIAAVTISVFANGNTVKINAIISFNFKCYKKFKELETISSPNY